MRTTRIFNLDQPFFAIVLIRVNTPIRHFDACKLFTYIGKL